jgi:hypothetical protein
MVGFIRAGIILKRMDSVETHGTDRSPGQIAKIDRQVRGNSRDFL